MPRIPVLDGPRIQSQPLPIPQGQPVSPNAFGAQVGEGLQQVGGSLGRIAQEEQDKADAARLTQVGRQLDEVEHQYLFDPEHGALQTKGYDTLPIYEQTKKAFDTATAAIAEGLANPRQKQAFAAMRDQRWRSMGNALESHTHQETQRADAEESAAASASAGQMAVAYYDTPARRDQEIARGVGIIQSWAKRSGLGAEAVAGRVAEFKSLAHAGVVERALANDQTGFAREYLTAHKDEITGDRVAVLEKAVQQGATLADAFIARDRIVAQAKDWTEASKLVGEITDPEVRRATQQEVDAHYQRVETQHRVAENNLFDHWADRLETVHSINQLRREMGADWQRLDQNSRVALEGRAAQIAKGPAIENDDTVWVNFMFKNTKEMAAVNPMKELRPHLDDEHFNQAVRLIAEAKRGGIDGDAEARANMTDLTTDNEQRLAAARKLGIVPETGTPTNWTATQNADFARFGQRVQAMLDAATIAKGGKKLTPTERQTVFDQVSLERVRKDVFGPDWLRPTWKAAITVSEDDAGKFYVPIEQVPTPAQTDLKNTLSRIRLKDSNANVEKMYALWLIRAAAMPGLTFTDFLEGVARFPADLANEGLDQ